MTIYEIKSRTAENQPFFFSRETMKFFHQTLKDFRIKKQADGKYRISAPIRDHAGKVHGETVRFFNPTTNDFEGDD
jgi:hypothetical protein